MITHFGMENNGKRLHLRVTATTVVYQGIRQDVAKCLRKKREHGRVEVFKGGCWTRRLSAQVKMKINIYGTFVYGKGLGERRE